MDATKKPLLIPPEFSNYAEKHNIFQIYESLLTKLIIEQPADPLTYMIGLLEQESEVPQIIIHGPPAAGKRTMSVMAAEHFDCVHITLENLLAVSDSKSSKKAQEYISAKEMVPTHIWVSLIKERLQKEDCISKGWLLEAFPQTREQAQALQAEGINPRHFVLLEAPDTVLIERVMGKRIDPETGDVYHSTFDPPTDPAVVQRLVPDSKSSEKVMIQRLMEYHRHIDGILMCFEKIHKSINVDQPKADVFSQVLSYLKMNHRNNAPHTPRLILLGPTGCGKSVQAELLASKYGLVNVSCTELIKQSLVDDSNVGDAVRPYTDRHMLVPDDLVLQLLKYRLAQLDAVTKGWVIHGFPKTREQARALTRAGYEANRVIFMDVPTDTILERLTLRSVDPVTGERYHLIYNPPRTNEVKQRLHTSPKDVESAVNSRIAQYQAYVEEIAEYYEESVQHINADQDIHTVFECIESIIVNPIPTKNEV
ncbi:adenylate kinase 8-like [Stylophora pistillata]|uniref:Adenylate kinase 8 n=1 Tax=Stylophora pistillata TaxID=50429 RepID=A0A2B4SKE4_STYPI|nr:adenylate kinase 8-like [Stylophora pistillata]PFX30351.1 Adenylate kinase 8 [Stylophora pistillata]